MIAYEIETISWRMPSTESFNSFWILTSIFSVWLVFAAVAAIAAVLPQNGSVFLLLFFASMWLHWSKIMCVIFFLSYTVAIEISNSSSHMQNSKISTFFLSGSFNCICVRFTSIRCINGGSIGWPKWRRTEQNRRVERRRKKWNYKLHKTEQKME